MVSFQSDVLYFQSVQHKTIVSARYNGFIPNKLARCNAKNHCNWQIQWFHSKANFFLFEQFIIKPSYLPHTIISFQRDSIALRLKTHYTPYSLHKIIVTIFHVLELFLLLNQKVRLKIYNFFVFRLKKEF